MIISSKAKRLLAGTCATMFVVLASCGKGPDKGAATPQVPGPAASVATPTNPDIPARFKGPPLPDPHRTDPEAVAMRLKFYQWQIAQENADNAAAVKQANLALGLDKPAPKGNYGSMTAGLPQQSSTKN